MSIGYQSALQQLNLEPAAVVGRRELLLALFGLWAGVVVCAPLDLAGDLAGNDSECAALGDWLQYHGASCFSDLPALRQLGARYLLTHPRERSRRLLSRLLINGGGGTVPTRIICAISRDWSDHHLTLVDGWLLARSEARLCAVLHLNEAARA
jgi:hypothetical protein